jgi:hypothetical protein
MDRRSWDLVKDSQRERLQWIEHERLAKAARDEKWRAGKRSRPATLVVILIVILTLVFLGVLTVRATSAAAPSDNHLVRLLQMNQVDNLGQPGIHLQAYPRLGRGDAVSGVRLSHGPARHLCVHAKGPDGVRAVICKPKTIGERRTLCPGFV